MHNVYNRDDFVTIRWENIEAGKEGQFKKYINSEEILFNTTYDYNSIMHYGAYFFSKNGRPTIVPKVSHCSAKLILYQPHKLILFSNQG